MHLTPVITENIPLQISSIRVTYLETQLLFISWHVNANCSIQHQANQRAVILRQNKRDEKPYISCLVFSWHQFYCYLLFYGQEVTTNTDVYQWSEPHVYFITYMLEIKKIIILKNAGSWKVFGNWLIMYSECLQSCLNGSAVCSCYSQSIMIQLFVKY